MTLFHLREFWTTNCGNEEEFDKSSICISNIDNSPDGLDKIVLGSLNGILRIYKVELNTEIKNEQNLFQISDLLLEVDFKIPILQIASGFLLTSNNIQLAILHPNKISVYSISSTSGVTDHGTSYNILLIYEIKFENKAANMLIGSLGQSKVKDIICVQSMDSTFNFYENESLFFGYCWNKSNIEKFPMEFTYIPNRDVIIIVDELFNIQCFQYQELAMNSTGSQNENSAKVCTPDWSYSFGEFVIDIQTVQLDKCYIVILGKRNLCVLYENGILFFVKKFDVNPSCLYAFANDQKNSLIILIGTQIGNMLVYQNDILRWATKIPFVPVCIRRANLNDITGSIVLLSDQGQLTVGYLGTNPSLRIIPLENYSNFKKIEEELKEFKKIVNLEQSNNRANSSESKLSNCINLKVIKCRKNNSEYLTMYLEIIPLTRILKMKLLFHQNDFYEIIPNEQIIENLNDSFKMEIEVKFKLNLLPLSTKIKCIIMYSIDNVSRIITKSLRIPFECLIKIISSSSSHKYLLKVNVQKISNEKLNLINLFDNVLDQTNHSHSNSFSFCFNNYEQIHATIKMIVMEKNCYLIESNDLSGLYISVKEFFRRIKIKSTNIKIISFILNFNLIEHLRLAIKYRMEKKALLLNHKNEIAKFSQHYRVLQKRILVKSKDKTPTSLDNLEKLLSLIQKRINKNIDKIIFYEKIININNYHVWTILNLLKVILQKSRKTETLEVCERFIKLISIHQLSNFIMDWEELFISSIHEILNMNNDIGNLMKIINYENINIDHFGKILNHVFEKLSHNLLPIEFV